MATNLRPLEEAALERLRTWLPKLANPVRIGEHDQTAFALGLMLDYARGTGDQRLAGLVISKARQFYCGDKDCPLAYEPSGEDFLSPCIGEADLMRRVLPNHEFAVWLRTFLPQIPASGSGTWHQPVVSPDPSDPKLAHLDGLNSAGHGCWRGLLDFMDFSGLGSLTMGSTVSVRGLLINITGAPTLVTRAMRKDQGEGD